MDQPIAISFFTGIGGIDLAAQYAGFRLLVMVEIDPFCQRVLKTRFPDAILFGDIREVTGDKIRNAMIERGYFPSVYTGPLASLVVGGPPCQAASEAGKRLGTADERWLWPEYFRLVREIDPRWVVAENVSGLLSLGADDIPGGEFGVLLRELAQMGFRVGWGLYGADDVGAPHERHRVFIVANSYQRRFSGEEHPGWNEPTRNHTRRSECDHRSGDSCCEVADAAGDGPQGRREPGWAVRDEARRQEPELRSGSCGEPGQGTTQPGLGRAEHDELPPLAGR